MATNGKPGDNRRHGAVKDRSQTFNPTINHWVKRDTETGKFIDVKLDETPFKGVSKERGGKMSKKKINTIISHFSLDKQGLTQDNVDFFNINLDKDNLAFFDYNRILKHSSSILGKKIEDNLRIF